MYQCNVVIDLEFNPVKREFTDLISQEIIEIGAVKLNAENEVTGKFSCLVCPEMNDGVEPKIARLTGIRTADVANAVYLDEALAQLSAWIGGGDVRILSWSGSDPDQLERECFLKDIPLPENMSRWLDLQRVFQRVINYPRSQSMALRFALKTLGISFDSENAHRALYDAEVTTQLFQHIKRTGYLRDIARSRSLFLSENERPKVPFTAACGISMQEMLMKLKLA